MRGARASANLYSLIETAKANGVEPYAWLAHVLRTIPPAQTADEYEALMPGTSIRASELRIRLAG